MKRIPFTYFRTVSVIIVSVFCFRASSSRACCSFSSSLSLCHSLPLSPPPLPCLFDFHSVFLYHNKQINCEWWREFVTLLMISVFSTLLRWQKREQKPTVNQSQDANWEQIEFITYPLAEERAWTKEEGEETVGMNSNPRWAPQVGTRCSWTAIVGEAVGGDRAGLLALSSCNFSWKREGESSPEGDVGRERAGSGCAAFEHLHISGIVHSAHA